MTRDQTALGVFLTKAPLYSWRNLELPEYPIGLKPGQLFLFCNVCGGERPFLDDRPSGSGSPPGGYVEPPKPIQEGDLFIFYVRCGFCAKQKYFFWVETDPTRGRVRKVGQSPPWSIDIDREIADRLGEDVELYKRGLICLSQGYGLAACTYFRRLLEARVDSILELLESFLATDTAAHDQAKEVAEIRKGKVADRKLEQASPYVPPSLLVEGVNPIRLLYEQLSVGVHGLDEEQCSELAAEISETLVYVLSELARAVSSRDRFIDRVREISRRRRERKEVSAP
jgi:hypothetical protein